MGNYFITGTGTEVGKTIVMSAICSRLIESKKSVFALKPLVSGWCDHNNDVVKILHALSLPITQRNIDLISYKRLKMPVAPNIAAEHEGITIDFDEVVGFCMQHLDKYEYCFIEGAGGVMSPLTNYTTYRDLIRALNIQVILVATVYLGVISHILTALEALDGCIVRCIVINPYKIKDNLNHIEIKRAIEGFTKVPVVIYTRETILSTVGLS